MEESNQSLVNGSASESFLSDLPLNSFSASRTGMQPLSGTRFSLDSISVGSPPVAPEDSSAFSMASFLARLASDWDEDDPAYDPRLRFEEDSDTGDEGDDEISSTLSRIDRTIPDYFPSRDFDNIENNDVGPRFEDSPVSWVDSPVSGWSSPTSEDDGSDDLEAPSIITLKAIRKHSNRRHGIYGGFVKKDVRESPSPELLADSPASDSTSPTSVGSESDEFEGLSANVLEQSREHLNRRLGIFGDTPKQVLSPSEVPFLVSVDDAVACDFLPPRRRQLLSTHSLHVQRKRVSGLQPLQLPRIVSMRHLAVGDPLPSKDTFRRVSHCVHEPKSSTGA